MSMLVFLNFDVRKIAKIRSAHLFFNINHANSLIIKELNSELGLNDDVFIRELNEFIIKNKAREKEQQDVNQLAVNVLQISDEKCQQLEFILNYLNQIQCKDFIKKFSLKHLSEWYIKENKICLYQEDFGAFYSYDNTISKVHALLYKPTEWPQPLPAELADLFRRNLRCEPEKVSAKYSIDDEQTLQSLYQFAQKYYAEKVVETAEKSTSDKISLTEVLKNNSSPLHQAATISPSASTKEEVVVVMNTLKKV